MLTQMESFDGIFIASTNLIDGLDQASLRRFDLKVKFDFLGPNSAWELFLRHCKDLGLAQPEPALRARLLRLAKLTPGDFAAVARQTRFRALGAPVDLLKALEAECAIKAPGRSQPMGFVWPPAGPELNHPQGDVMPAFERSLCTGSSEPGRGSCGRGAGVSR
jgi:SpoVK/Ycf46/Vps4 family AAA+-type ATPase